MTSFNICILIEFNITQWHRFKVSNTDFTVEALVSKILKLFNLYSDCTDIPLSLLEYFSLGNLIRLFAPLHTRICGFKLLSRPKCFPHTWQLKFLLLICCSFMCWCREDFLNVLLHSRQFKRVWTSWQLRMCEIKPSVFENVLLHTRQFKR